MSRPTRTLLSLVLLLAIACGEDAPKAHIRGAVQDAFDQPLAGVQVQIVNTEFAAVSEEAGHYAIPFARGSFKVKYSKKGFAKEIVPLSISEQADFPAGAVTLFPSPQKGGFFALGEEGLVELPLRAIERFGHRGNFDRGTRYYVKSLAELPVLAPGRSRFIDADEIDQRLARVTAQGLVYEVTKHYGSSEETYAEFGTSSTARGRTTSSRRAAPTSCVKPTMTWSSATGRSPRSPTASGSTRSSGESRVA